jgi:hypothetical protein
MRIDVVFAERLRRVTMALRLGVRARPVELLALRPGLGRVRITPKDQPGGVPGRDGERRIGRREIPDCLLDALGVPLG